MNFRLTETFAGSLANFTIEEELAIDMVAFNAPSCPDTLSFDLNCTDEPPRSGFRIFCNAEIRSNGCEAYPLPR